MGERLLRIQLERKGLKAMIRTPPGVAPRAKVVMAPTNPGGGRRGKKHSMLE